MANNKLNRVSILGNYTGGDDNSRQVSITTDDVATAKRLLHDLKVIEEFSISAQQYLSEVAEIVRDTYQLQDTKEDHGLDEKKINEKFSNMKCSQTYIDDFNEMSSFFHVLSTLEQSDSVKGGANTVRMIISLIKKMYLQYLDDSSTGDEIHNKIVSELMKRDNQSYYIAANIFVYYIIRGCGIFNETK